MRESRMGSFAGACATPCLLERLRNLVSWIIGTIGTLVISQTLPAFTLVINELIALVQKFTQLCRQVNMFLFMFA